VKDNKMRSSLHCGIFLIFVLVTWTFICCLLLAFEYGYFDVVNELLLQGADINTKNENGDTLLKMGILLNVFFHWKLFIILCI
jgi:hypothetical protein